MMSHNYKCNIINCIFTFVFALLSVSIKAENKDIVIMSSVDNEIVRLRWSPINHELWQVANKYGYTLERYIFDKKKSMTMERSDVYRPLSISEWRIIADTNDRAAIVSEAMFGENFEIANEDTSALRMTNVAKEQDMRFSFAMLMAAQDFDLACKMGVGSLQKIEPGKKYMYKVFINAPDSIVKCDTGSCIVTSNDMSQLPDILSLNAVYVNGRVELRWPRATNEDYYAGYHIERSSDSVNYKRVNKSMFVPFESVANEQNYTFSDTVNNKTDARYYYRIQGVNFFGEYSKYSPVAAVSTYKPITETPYITELEDAGGGNIRVTWEFPVDEQQQLSGFQILVSDYVADNYMPMLNDLLPSETRQCVVPTVGPSNYVIVAAYDKSGIEYLSMPKFIQPIDSIPPKAPVGLKGSMNSEGVVSLDWTANTEPDIAGYRVFYTTDKYMDYTNLTNRPITENHFEYKFPLNWLNRNIYVTVLAEDAFYNFSDFSDTIAVKVFDTIPPSPAVFRSYESTDSAICMEWVNSSSSDLMATRLVRTDGANADTLLSFKDEHTQFCDSGAKSDKRYEYTIVSIDSAGNKSLSNTIAATGKHKPYNVTLKVKFDAGENAMVLSWDNDDEKQTSAYIYKAANGGKLYLFKTISGEETTFVDRDVEINRPYSYRVKVKLENGKTAITKTVNTQ